VKQVIESIFSILLDVFRYVVDTGSDFAVSAIQSRRKTQYTADFVPPQAMFKKGAGGFSVCEWSTSIKGSFEHMICTGGSGSHKSTAVAFPSVGRAGEVSFVINDPFREMLPVWAPYLTKQGYLIKISNTIMRNGLDGEGNDFWAKSGENLTSLLLRILCQATDPKYHNLPSLLSLVNTFSHSPEKVDELASNCSAELLNEYKAFCSMSEKTMQSVVAMAKAALSIYAAPNIQQVCSHNTMQFDEFFNSKKALFLCSSPADAHLYRGIIASFFESFWGHILRSNPKKVKYPLLFLVDEAASMHIKSLSSAISLLRKNFVGIALFMQDYSQLEHLYGRYEANNIIANCALKVHMPGAKSLELCKALEARLGRFEYQDDSGVVKTRELMTAQEISQLDKILVLYKQYPPSLIPVVPYFKQRRFKRLAENPPFEPKSKLPNEISILKL
jgi:type IV secretory pathway TraG/TraD family ATPase VirD4